MYLALCVACLLMAGDPGMPLVQACLSRGDALGAQQAMKNVAEPSLESSQLRAEWLDASSRLAWSRGEMDQSFAWMVEAVVLAERTGLVLPPLTESLTPDRAWMDPAFGLSLFVLPTGDRGEAAHAMAAQLLALREAAEPSGVWIAFAAKLLDESVVLPAAAKVPDTTKALPQHRRRALLQAACESRYGKSISEARETLRGFGRDQRQALRWVRWFDAEGRAREGPDQSWMASLRFTQSAAECADAPWLRVAALRRAAKAIHSTDSSEAARLEAAANKEIP